MEGVYDWLDVNYLNLTFQENTPSVGSLDMGGASTQIAFNTEDKSDLKNTVPITLNGITYNIHSNSYLGLGQDQARHTMALSKNADSCYPIGYQSNASFNYSTCTDAYSEVITPFNIDVQIPADQKFIAFSGAYYDYVFFKMKTLEQTDVENTIKTVCSETWSELKTNYPTESDAYLANYCANGTYVTNLFYNYYHLLGKNLQVVNQIEQHGIDWTLGALLYDLTLHRKPKN